MRFSKLAGSSALGLAAMVMVAVLTACGGATGNAVAGGVDKASLTAKMKEEAEIKELPDTALSCLADVALKYGDSASLQAYIDGSVKSIDDVKGLGKENKEFEDAGFKCVD
ncbi:hypothetical protein [Nonomuraea jiangxiensis]|nr:hypothetical protein [Nonomuraea jiangxiensis]